MENGNSFPILLPTLTAIDNVRHALDRAIEANDVDAVSALTAALKSLAVAASRIHFDAVPALRTDECPLRGRIVALFISEDHGFITTDDGREIYFHRDALSNASFETLVIGQVVELVVATCPRAQTVKLISPTIPRRVI